MEHFKCMLDMCYKYAETHLEKTLVPPYGG